MIADAFWPPFHLFGDTVPIAVDTFVMWALCAGPAEETGNSDREASDPSAAEKAPILERVLIERTERRHDIT
ncbi:hypothetical protein [Streptomyces sp. NPDC026092]|uniref:hypothetical protein n=1 Tax=Streptomyces sp. NPDC026092 TaxID=3154797 RepID=UPI0033CF4C98